ncbi:hypothetical protein I317_00759 [Kwoniella heveanensis CBS 569]|uniref:Uncharacterized protein n=1 Tax=Kwoniella heveanensis BCC8398 TaxID=1296120 RepID=A0A1B9GPI1_9TREE|nr:hypothetical protein I316_05550 [Kwoniella heveanensis BCC8398]OCF45237.1 hypothetical protein I317_00759 [Kwoniella heveanensis CBS 569]
MFHSAKRTFAFLLRTPVVPPTASASAPAAVELSTFAPSASAAGAMAGPSRLRAGSRTLSSMSIRPIAPGSLQRGTSYEMRRGYASDKGKKELYSDEAGSTGAGTDDVAHTDAAFNKNPDPSSSAKQVENETGKDFTNRSPAQAGYSHSPGKQGEKGSETPLNTSKEEAKKNQ